MKTKSIYPRLFVWFIILLLLTAYLYVGQIYITYGPSMEPTLYTGDRILVDKKAYSVVKPAPGDVVAFPTPHKRAFYVKRVVAEAGDEVNIGPNGVSVNSELLKNSVGSRYYYEFTLKEDEIFVLGDNRNNSEDSRDFGPIKAKSVIGEVKFILWPPSRWGGVK